MESHKKKSLYFLLLVFLFNSCSIGSINDEAIRQKISSIDSLIHVIENTDSLLNSINVDTIVKYKKEVMNNLDSIKMHYTDTLSWERIKFLGKYNSIKKPLKRFIDKKSFYRNKIDFAIKQLLNLKHDVENELLTTEQFTEYFKLEINAVSNLNKDVQFNVDLMSVKMELFKSANPRIKEMLKKLKESGSGIREMNDG